MKISGFSFGRNTSKLYYPIKESILSVLPICHEFIFVLGKGDEDDLTLEILESINSPKLKIIHTEWDLDKYPQGTEYAHQTDIAKGHCSGDWLFYIQADEVIHEKFLPTIEKRCSDLLENSKVEGLLFHYKHFFADYNHYINDHGWYQNEVRIVRNLPEIHSFGDAQSFRRIENFDGVSYRKIGNTAHVNVATVDAYVYHYGWVRPPLFLQKKKKAMDSAYKSAAKVEAIYKDQSPDFDYGPLKGLPKFEGTHPKVMGGKMKDFDWGKQLNYTTNKVPDRKKFKHEKLKYRLISFLEKKLNGGRHYFPFKNWKVLDV
jgi:hypothetical protein